MPAAPIPKDETARIAALQQCGVLDTPDEEAWDDIAFVASQIARVPVALVSFVDEKRQWFKARVGFEPRGTPRSVSFCAHAILAPEPLVVEDATSDVRFSDNPLVTGDPRFRFYAGVPIKVGEESAIGTLCVLDYEPRVLDDAQLRSLKALARQVARELTRRRAATPPRARGDFVPHKGTLEKSTTVGRWTIVRHLASGAFGAVYEARDAIGRRAALKVLTVAGDTALGILDRFTQEARILMRVASPHVAALLDVGNLPEKLGSSPWLALEYLDGVDLARILDQRRRIPWRQAASWIADACDGVAGAHSLGVVHRDIKPANIVLCDGGVKVIDFGIAKQTTIEEGSALTAAGMILGSIDYMSPEQLLSSKSVDARSDVWSMGVTLYELVTGAAPFEGADELQTATAILRRPPLPMRAKVSDVPEDLDRLVRACLAKKREERPSSLLEVASALRAIAA